MSIFRSRNASSAAPPPSEGINFGVDPGTPLHAMLRAVSDGSMTRAVAIAALRRDRAESLPLSDMALDEAAAGVLEEALAKCGATALALTRVTFSVPAAWRRLCNGVAQSNTLRLVAVTHARLTDEQAHTLASALCMGKSPIATLDVSHNALCSPVDFLERIRRLTKLETLNLAGNTLLCVDTLASGVAGHWPALREVHVQRASMTREDMDVLRRAAEEGAARYREYSAHTRQVRGG
jgi:hypothetical protein